MSSDSLPISSTVDDTALALEKISLDETANSKAIAPNYTKDTVEDEKYDPVVHAANLIRKASRIVIMTGAGISVAAGIPDFRSKEGLYSMLGDYDLPQPEAIFSIEYFRHNPEPFWKLVKSWREKQYKPTKTHHFFKMLHDRQKLLRIFTQNIDGLEFSAGLPHDRVVQAHGGFQNAHCIECFKPHSLEFIDKCMDQNEIPHCDECSGNVKPAITFFGEGLPARFFVHVANDLSKADLLIVMGTSLVVQPFASLVDRVSKECPRILINREAVGDLDFDESTQYKRLQEQLELISSSENASVRHILQSLQAKIGHKTETKCLWQKRDIFCQGDCDDIMSAIAEQLGWNRDLEHALHVDNVPATAIAAKKTVIVSDKNTKNSNDGADCDSNPQAPQHVAPEQRSHEDSSETTTDSILIAQQ